MSEPNPFMEKEAEPFTGEKAEPKKSREELDNEARQGLPPTVVVETANSLMPLQKPDPKATGPWIRYNGIGSVRIMTPADWKAVGVDSNNYYEWNYLNKKRLPRKAFSAAELQYLLRVDGRFSLVEE